MTAPLLDDVVGQIMKMDEVIAWLCILTVPKERPQMKKLGYLISALLVGSLIWLGIWVAAISALYQTRKERKMTSAWHRHSMVWLYCYFVAS